MLKEKSKCKPSFNDLALLPFLSPYNTQILRYIVWIKSSYTLNTTRTHGLSQVQVTLHIMGNNSFQNQLFQRLLSGGASFPVHSPNFNQRGSGLLCTFHSSVHLCLEKGVCCYLYSGISRPNTILSSQNTQNQD